MLTLVPCSYGGLMFQSPVLPVWKCRTLCGKAIRVQTLPSFQRRCGAADTPSREVDCRRHSLAAPRA